MPNNEELKSLLDAAPVDNDIRYSAWEAFNGSASKQDFIQAFDAINLPKETKRQLWFMKFPDAAQKAQRKSHGQQAYPPQASPDALSSTSAGQFNVTPPLSEINPQKVPVPEQTSRDTRAIADQVGAALRKDSKVGGKNTVTSAPPVAVPPQSAPPSTPPVQSQGTAAVEQSEPPNTFFGKVKSAWSAVAPYLTQNAFQTAGGASLTDVYDHAADATVSILENATGIPRSQMRQDFPAVAFVNQLVRAVPELGDFMMSPAGAALPFAKGIAPVEAGIHAAFATDMGVKAEDALRVAYENPTAENLGAAAKSVGMALMPWIHAGKTEAATDRVREQIPQAEPPKAEKRSPATAYRPLREPAQLPAPEQKPGMALVQAEPPKPAEVPVPPAEAPRAETPPVEVPKVAEPGELVLTDKVVSIIAQSNGMEPTPENIASLRSDIQAADIRDFVDEDTHRVLLNLQKQEQGQAEPLQPAPVAAEPASAEPPRPISDVSEPPKPQTQEPPKAAEIGGGTAEANGDGVVPEGDMQTPPAVAQEGGPVSPASGAVQQVKDVVRANAELANGGDVDVASVYKANVDDIGVDPVRFQFKSNVGQGGVTDEYKGVKWNPRIAGVIAVWRDPADGKTYVVNGHHRLQLAKDNGIKNINVVEISADNATEARGIGALINIADNKGNAVDAAKVLRDMGYGDDVLQEFGISPKTNLAKYAMALRNLTPEVFSKVTSGEFEVEPAAVIGRMLPSDPVSQISAMSLIQRAAAAGKRLTTSETERLIDRAKNAPKIEIQDAQGDIFGNDTRVQDLAVETVILGEYVAKELAREKRLFSAVGKESAAAQLGKAGNEIKAEQNAKIAEETAQALAIYNKLSNKSGPINRALEDGATRIARGDNANKVREDVYEQVRREIAAAIEGRGPKDDQGGAAVVEGAGSDVQSSGGDGVPGGTPGTGPAEAGQQSLADDQPSMFGGADLPSDWSEQGILNWAKERAAREREAAEKHISELESARPSREQEIEQVMAAVPRNGPAPESAIREAIANVLESEDAPDRFNKAAQGIDWDGNRPILDLDNPTELDTVRAKHIASAIWVKLYGSVSNPIGSGGKLPYFLGYDFDQKLFDKAKKELASRAHVDLFNRVAKQTADIYQALTGSPLPQSGGLLEAPKAQIEPPKPEHPISDVVEPPKPLSVEPPKPIEPPSEPPPQVVSAEPPKPKKPRTPRPKAEVSAEPPSPNDKLKQDLAQVEADLEKWKAKQYAVSDRSVEVKRDHSIGNVTAINEGRKRKKIRDLEERKADLEGQLRGEPPKPPKPQKPADPFVQKSGLFDDEENNLDLFSPQDETATQQAAKSHTDKLLGDRLSAEFNTPINAANRRTKLKPGEKPVQFGMFSEPPKETGPGKLFGSDDPGISLMKFDSGVFQSDKISMTDAAKMMVSEIRATGDKVPRLYVDVPTQKVLTGILAREWPDSFTADDQWYGMNLPQDTINYLAYKVVDAAQDARDAKMDPKVHKNMMELAGNLQEIGANPDGAMFIEADNGTISRIKTTVRHEQVHAAQRKAISGLRTPLFEYDKELAADPEFKALADKFAKTLFSRQYKPSHVTLFNEALAYLGTGSHAKLGLTADEAMSFLDGILTRIAKTHGPEKGKEILRNARPGHSEPPKAK